MFQEVGGLYGASERGGGGEFMFWSAAKIIKKCACVQTFMDLTVHTTSINT